MTLEKIHEITSALKRGAEVKIKIRGSQNKWTTISLKDNYFIDINDEYIDILITEPKEPRLPTIDEIFQWFKKGKIFKHIETNTYIKIITVRAEVSCEYPIYIISHGWITIQEFINLYTDENGNSLLIQD